MTFTSTQFEDLSGAGNVQSSNPFDALILTCQNDKAKIQNRYMVHRSTRNAQQKAKMLSDSFAGFDIDPILQKLERNQSPPFVDPRHCLVFWARPPRHLQALIGTVQDKLRITMPNLWLMPIECLHMTALEITHSQTDPVINSLVEKLGPQIPTITDYAYYHRARLIKPMLGFDSSAIAISFVPADRKDIEFQSDADIVQSDDYTYHHLRRSLYEMCTEAGIEIASRYTVPSAHLTIARFITQEDITEDSTTWPRDDATSDSMITQEATSGGVKVNHAKVKALIDTIEDINAWLHVEYWPQNGKAIKAGGEWIVGEERGLDCRKGTLWYGGGETVHLGKSFSR